MEYGDLTIDMNPDEIRLRYNADPNFNDVPTQDGAEGEVAHFIWMADDEELRNIAIETIDAFSSEVWEDLHQRLLRAARVEQRLG